MFWYVKFKITENSVLTMSSEEFNKQTGHLLISMFSDGAENGYIQIYICIHTLHSVYMEECWLNWLLPNFLKSCILKSILKFTRIFHFLLSFGSSFCFFVFFNFLYFIFKNFFVCSIFFLHLGSYLNVSLG